MVQIMFEKFEVRKVYIANQAVASLVAHGRDTGLVIDSGDGVSYTVPISNGNSIPFAIQKMEIAGSVLTNYVMGLLPDIDEFYTPSTKFDIVKSIKEATCFVALDFETEHTTAESSSVLDQ